MLVAFAFAVLVNGVVEWPVVARLFGIAIGHQGFWLLCLANSISVGVAFASVFVNPPTIREADPEIVEEDYYQDDRTRERELANLVRAAVEHNLAKIKAAAKARRKPSDRRTAADQG